MTQSARYGWLLPSVVRLGVAVTCIYLVISCVSAQELEPPKGTGPLPDLSKGAKAGAVVTSQYIHLYRSLLPYEIAELVGQGEFAFEAVKAPRNPARLRQSFEQVAELQQSGELKSIPSMPRPAGLFQVGDTVAEDQKQFAYKVLWNWASVLWRYRSVTVGLAAYLFQKSDASPQKFEFLVERIYPLALQAPQSRLQPLFREKVSAKKPSAINGLSWLTLRYFGNSEDFVWIASPVVQGIRQVTGSNRSDQIFSGAFSVDDLFVWSGKVELVEPVAITRGPLLVPILEAKSPVVEKNDACSSLHFSTESTVTMQCQATRFKATGSWIPTNTLMALRSVYKIDLLARDPFSVESRHVVYFDSDSGLPVYRVVWDQSGRLKKVTMGVLGSFEFEAGKPTPFLAGQVTIHTQDGKRVALVNDSASVCDRYIPGRALDDFDPSTFVRFSNQLQATATPRVVRATDGQREEASDD